MMQPKSKLKRGGSMQSIETNGSAFGVPVAWLHLWQRSQAKQAKTADEMKHEAWRWLSIPDSLIFVAPLKASPASPDGDRSPMKQKMEDSFSGGGQHGQHEARKIHERLGARFGIRHSI